MPMEALIAVNIKAKLPGSFNTWFSTPSQVQILTSMKKCQSCSSYYSGQFMIETVIIGDIPFDDSDRQASKRAAPISAKKPTLKVRYKPNQLLKVRPIHYYTAIHSSLPISLRCSRCSRVLHIPVSTRSSE